MYREIEAAVYQMIVRGEKVKEIRVGPDMYFKLRDEWQQMTGNYNERLESMCDRPLEVVQVPSMIFEVR